MNPIDSAALNQDWPAQAGLPPPACSLFSGPMPADLEGIVRIAAVHNYSDVHLGVGEEPRFRFRGDIIRTGWPVTDADTFGRWTEEMLSMSLLEGFRRK